MPGRRRMPLMTTKPFDYGMSSQRIRSLLKAHGFVGHIQQALTITNPLSEQETSTLSIRFPPCEPVPFKQIDQIRKLLKVKRKDVAISSLLHDPEGTREHLVSVTFSGLKVRKLP